MDALKWWQKTIVYEIYTKSFCDSNGDGIGDLPGITSKLDYLQSLGVGAIWLTPIYESPMVDNGYDIADYCSIAPEYGTMADMEELIVEAKKRNIRIVMDLVFNHTSDRHAWFEESRSSRENEKRDWYIWADAKADGSAPTNWRSIFSGSAWTLDERTGQYYLHTFASAQPDLNWENPKVRQALYQAASFWLDKGVGGFRIDAIVYIKKPKAFLDADVDGPDGLGNIHSVLANQPGILDFLREFGQQVFAGKDIFTVAEANGVRANELNQWVGKEGVFDMLFEFSHVDLGSSTSGLWSENKPWQLSDLKKALRDSQLATAKNGWYPIFFENHDQPRGIDHFFPSMADCVLAAKALATIFFTLRGTPFIYEGQELGLHNMKFSSIEQYDDILSKGQYGLALQNGYTPAQALEFIWKFSRDNARVPMTWSDALHNGFSAGQPWLSIPEEYAALNAKWQAGKADSVLAYYQGMAKLRQKSEVLLHGRYEELLQENEKIYAFRRVLGTEGILVLVNFSTQEACFELAELAQMKNLYGNYPDVKPGTLRSLEARIYWGRCSVHEAGSK